MSDMLVQSEDAESEDDSGGCILAHSMGLGKSLQTLAFLHTYHTYYPGNRSLLVVPANVLHNWVEEAHRWLPEGRTETECELTPSKVTGLLVLRYLLCCWEFLLCCCLHLPICRCFFSAFNRLDSQEGIRSSPSACSMLFCCVLGCCIQCCHNSQYGSCCTDSFWQKWICAAEV